MESSLKKTFRKSRITYALKIALSVFISFSMGKKISEMFSELDPVIGGLWSVISSIFVLEEGHLETYKASLLRILGSLIGSISSALFLLMMGETLWTLIACIFFNTILCSLLKLHDYLKIANVAVAVIIIVAQIQHPSNTWLFCLSRFLDSAIGIGASIAVLHFFHFEKPKTRRHY